MGAIVPSSERLAKAIAREVDFRRPGVIVELGGGTGSITRALVERAGPGNEIVVIEREASLCHRLAARFPGIRVICGDAEDLQGLLAEAGIGPVGAIVSGLPLLSISRRSRDRIIRQSFAVLGGDGVFVQFTYGLTSPVRRPTAILTGIVACRAGWVLRNLPPATLWRYSREDAVTAAVRSRTSRRFAWPPPVWLRRIPGEAIELLRERTDAIGRYVRRRFIYGLTTPARRPIAMRGGFAVRRAGWIRRNLAPPPLWRYWLEDAVAMAIPSGSALRFASRPLGLLRRISSQAVELFLHGAQLVPERADLIDKVFRR
jgi:phosphatidylethanolamine/phosphatidyl-N-methylethanolamine N-methyltransferase